MSKVKTKEEITLHKEAAISKLNSLLDEFIQSDKKEFLKKADLLSYWIEEYSNYIKKEKEFDCKRLKSYKRGDIVKLNFGFNVGSEYGGLHYAVVINNNNARNSPVVTVVPLTSYETSDDVHPDDVFLGNEIYKSLKLKHDTISQRLEPERVETLQYIKAIEAISDALSEHSEEAENPENMINMTLLKNLKDDLNAKLKLNASFEEQLNKIGTEISHMKSGSIALVNLTTTVSKMRIYDPRNSNGVLSGIRLSPESMDKINEKLKEFFIFS